MSYKNQQEFLKELVSEFDVNRDTLRCYTLESNPEIKVMLFGKRGWENCHIGFLINHQFHVLGLGSFACINEDTKKLYVSLSCSLPQEEQILKVHECSLFDEEEQINIRKQFNQIFPKR